jgi:hypothetical protein
MKTKDRTMNLAQTSTPVTYACVTNRARAARFYTETLGFTVCNSGPHAGGAPRFRTCPRPKPSLSLWRPTICISLPHR